MTSSPVDTHLADVEGDDDEPIVTRPEASEAPTKKRFGGLGKYALMGVGAMILAMQITAPRQAQVKQAIQPTQAAAQPVPTPTPTPTPEQPSIKPSGGILDQLVSSGYAAIGTGQDARAEYFLRKAQESGDAEGYLGRKLIETKAALDQASVQYGNLDGTPEQIEITRATLGDLVAISRALQMLRQEIAIKGEAVGLRSIAEKAEQIKTYLIQKRPDLLQPPQVIPPEVATPEVKP